MDLFDFTDDEKLALLDLLILGMYSDAHLTLKEDEKVQGVLDTFGFKTKKERYKCFDEAITRVRRHVDSFEEACDYAVALADCFTTPDRRRRACEALDLMFRSEKKVNQDEMRFLSAVRKVFKA